MIAGDRTGDDMPPSDGAGLFPARYNQVSVCQGDEPITSKPGWKQPSSQ